ncbi:hypothetical protein FB45DRAFT_1018815 [Roridomyces roridus]|uniref:F-box domain-containing protein n=1 Tax=Roridomyces roridus TaxID=1738132 RepID=A0AAD7CDL6_9AGAR|nr:hypothetical protein FB45DRAFT_1018815 [Roridomyces roridus]
MALCSSYHATLLRSIVAHKSILSSTRRLPNELLAEIFTVVVRDEFYRRSNSGPMSEYPWVLTRVCRRWRAVAVGTHSLWSWVFLDLDVMPGVGGVVSRTKLFCERSGNSPLEIKIEQRREKPKRHDVFNVVLAHAERWQYLSLSLPGESVLAINSDMLGRLDALTTLRIRTAVGTRFEPIDSFTTAPNLTAVCLWTYNVTPPFPLPWKQLTCLSTTLASNKEALSILPQLSHIVELRLVFRDSAVGVLPPNSITLVCLRSLEMRQHGLNHVTSSSLLDCLTCPILEHLMTERTALVDTVLRFIARSGCSRTLNSFYFLLRSMSAEKVLALVHEMPCLSTLQIGDFQDGTASKSSCIVRALHSHWLTVRRNSRTSRLVVRLVDHAGWCLPVYDVGVDADAFSTAKNDGLSIEISAWPKSFTSVVDTKFQ